MSNYHSIVAAIVMTTCTVGATAFSNAEKGFRPAKTESKIAYAPNQYVRASDQMPGWLVQLRDVPSNGIDIQTRASRTIDQVLSEAGGPIEIRDSLEFVVLRNFLVK